MVLIMSNGQREGKYKRTRSSKVIAKGKNIQGQPVTVIRDVYVDRPIKKKKNKK